DPYYIKRREKTLLISIGCDFVFEDCFCATLGSLPYEFDSTDIGLMETADAFVVMFLSDKGQKTIEAFNKFFTAINTEEAQNYENIMTDKNKKSVEKMGLSWTDVDLEKIPGIMSESFGKDIWKKISEKCISCGACTFVCPTCYCFDIRDEQDAANVQRCRNWDFCTSFLYSLEASGHNPRNDISKRYKNKINCKYNYNYLRHKVLYCVGCGRCIDVCPVDMDIRNIVGSILKNHMKSNV
ncbi:MAG: 4Fe-4S dicluster domain-containing protein, partial [Actinomycetota bacterium]|nr:4Fe-4S dicluster domain-containing protein [Actinomycetota bacterium]